MVQSSTQNPFPRSHSHFSKNSHFFSRSHSHLSKYSHFFRWKFGSRTGERRTSGRCRRTGCLPRIMREPKKETWRGTRTWSTTRRRRTTLITTSNIPTTLMTHLLPLTTYRVPQGSSRVLQGPLGSCSWGQIWTSTNAKHLSCQINTLHHLWSIIFSLVECQRNLELNYLLWIFVGGWWSVLHRRESLSAIRSRRSRIHAVTTSQYL